MKPSAQDAKSTASAPAYAWVLPAAVAAVTLGVVAGLATVVIPTRGPLGWDEATHALKGLLLAHDLRQGDLLSLLYNSYRQVLYPPIHAWLLALAYLVAGPSPTVAVWVSLLLFGLGAGLLYWAGGLLVADRPNWVGAIAALLWITSPPLQRYAVQSMQEIPGLVALLVALGTMLWTLRRDAAGRAGRGTWLCLGLAVALVYFTRTPYGIILGLAVGITLLARAGWNPLKLWRAEIGWFLLPLVLLLAIWFAYWPKFGATFQWLVNFPDGVDDPYSVEGWLYYPLAVVRNSGSPWLFALYAGTLLWALLWSVVRQRSLTLGFLIALIAIQFGLGLFHQNKQARYLFPMLPALFLLAGYAVDRAGRWAAARSGWARALWAGFVLLGLLHSLWLVRAALVPGPGPRPDLLTPYVVAQVDQGPSTLVIGSMAMDYPGAPLLDWRLGAEAGVLLPSHAGAAVQIEEGRRLAQLVGRLPLPAGLIERLQRTFTAYDQPAALRTLYAQLPLRASYSQGPQAYAAFVTNLVQAQAVDQVIVVGRTGDGARFTPDALAAPLIDAGWTVHHETRFAESNMAAVVYRLPPCPADVLAPEQAESDVAAQRCAEGEMDPNPG
jgi:4-amino-4-deoxy-L-arabinose transferase-like glycosyltransferase